MKTRDSRPARLKPTLDGLYESFNQADSATDPIQIVRRFTANDDREIVGFFAAGLAFGRVSSVLQSIERVLAVMGDAPAQYVRDFDPARDSGPLREFVHRWIRGADIVALLWVLRQMLERSGSLEGFFVEDDPGGDDVRDALDSFSRRAMALDLRPAYGRVPTRPALATSFRVPPLAAPASA